MKASPATPPKRSRRLLWAAYGIPLIGCVVVMLMQPTPRRSAPADTRTHQVASAGDAMVWSILGVMLFIGGGVGLAAWHLAKRSRNPDPTLVFLDEILYPGNPTTPTAKPGGDAEAESPNGRAEWERSSEWWKEK